MPERFSRDDWFFVRSCADQVAVQLRAKGVQFEGFVGLPPVPYQQYRDFEAATGKALPNDFLELTRDFSGGWSFPWRLEVGGKWLNPPVSPSLIGTHDPFIWLDARTPLLTRYQDFQELLRESVDESPPGESTQFLLPLYKSAGGDCLALRFESDPATVVMLDHEAAFDVSRARTLGHGFREFVLRWATLGFPDCEDVARWVDDTTGTLVHDDQRAKDWLAWLADPDAK